jgi:hypothetical protein
MEKFEVNSAGNRRLLICGISSVVFLLLAYWVVVGRLTAWQDELFVVSAGLSIARTEPPIESVMGLYPQSDSPIKFYGPVSFEAEALLIRVFGLSLEAWRLACFVGVIFNLLIAVSLVRLGGGDGWAQLITILTLGISGFTAAIQPGRWDFVTSGLFFGGLLVLLPGIEAGARSLLWRAALAGTLIGWSLGSTPRALTLIFAAFLAFSLLLLFYPRIRRNLMLGAVGTGAVVVLVHNILLLPWGLNSFSWYAYVRKSTKLNPQNATPLTGTGGWGLDLNHHKTLTLIALCLLAATLCSIAARRGSSYANGKHLFRVFLALFAAINLVLMLLLTRGSLGLSSFWLTPVVVALMSWFDWRSLAASKLGTLASAFLGAALLILLVQGARQVAAISLTWSRRSTPELMAFVKQNVPEHAVVYGPISGYLYPVEMAGRTYLYLYEQEREVLPWLPENPHSDVAVPVTQEFDDQICAQPVYVMWPVPDAVRQPLEEPMPEAIRARLGEKVAEFHQPPLSSRKEAVLQGIGQVAGKYGFPDVAVFRLKSRRPCREG